MTADQYRTAVSLDGRWEFVTDPSTTGRTNGWYEPDAPWPDRSRTVDVPFAWEETEEFRAYTGTAWFRRSFSLENVEIDDREVQLEFGAVDYETTVWVNGEQVGENRGGYLPFSVEITDALVEDENEITLAVTDPEDLSEIPHGKQGDPWYTRVSGIWQSVDVVVQPRTRIVSARVTPDLETDTAAVELEVKRGGTGSSRLTATVEAQHNNDTAVTASFSLADRTTTELLFDDPHYWTPDDPALYDLTVTLERDGVTVDRYEDYFGLRSFEARDGQFYLNGDPLTIRGILDQGYYPETLYRPPTGDMFEREIKIADDLGFNLIRKHIKPAHPDFLELADRLGMLVWQEPANPTRYTERSRSELRTQLFEMIDRDYNRPSVVIWSIYNEEWGIGHYDTEETLWTDTEKQRFLADLYRDVCEYDTTRLVCDNSGWAHVATDINDYHRYFVSPEQATAWERDLDHICSFVGDNYATDEFDDPDAPIVISELGTWGIGNVDELKERYAGDPHWFDHEFLVEPLKSPAGVDDRFANTDLSDVFEDYGDLAAAWQEREFVSIKHLLEAMRTREEISGYVLTELSDIEWEFNGLLDYHREPKGFLDEFAAVNAPVAVALSPRSRAVRTGDELTIEATIINDRTVPVSGTLELSLLENAYREQLTVPANGVTATEFGVGATPVGSDRIERSDCTAKFDFEPAERTRSTIGKTVSTSEEITVVGDREELPDVTVFAEGQFASRLAERGISVTHGLSADVDLAFVKEWTGEIERFASDGGTVVQIPDSDGEMHPGGPFSFRSLPRTESWNVVAAFFYQDSPLLADLCPGQRLGWAFEKIYPHSVATDLDPTVDRTHVGYFEGWLANWGSPLVSRGYGQGSITVLSFRVTDRYGSHPIATELCDRLFRRLTE